MTGVLISSAGRRVALVEAFRESAAALGIPLRLIATDLAPDLSAACQVADAAHAVPPANDPRFVEATLALCRDEGIDLLVPTIDPELTPLAAAGDRFAAIGTRVLAHAPLVTIARDKLATSRWLDGLGVPVPITQTPDVVRDLPGSMRWPAIVKPRAGSASRGLLRVGNIADLPRAFDEPMVVQELLGGDEWTVNVFVTQGGRLGAVAPHRRITVRAGEVEKGVLAHHPALRRAAEAIAGALPGFSGVFCFQAMCDGASFGVFEINARFGGGYPLAHRGGARFTRWLLEEACGAASTVADDWQAGTTMLRYDAAVFTAA